MTSFLSPAELANLDQLHQANVAQFDQLIAAPDMPGLLETVGEALFCAHLTNSLEDAANHADMDLVDMAAMLAIAVARLVRINAEGTTK
jgi:hypothetical protein